MKKITISVLSIFVFSLSFSQTDITRYHLKGKVAQNFLYNPAERSDYRVDLSLIPSIGFSLSNFSSFNDVFTLNKAKDGYNINLKKLLSNIEDNKNTDIDLCLNVFNLGLNMGSGTSVGIFLNTRANLHLAWPYNLVKIAFEGNGGDNLKKELKDRVNLSVSSYNEIGFSFSKKFMEDDALAIGVNVKYLLGNIFADFGENGIDYSIKTDPDTYNITLDYQNYMLRGYIAETKLENYLSELENYLFKLENNLFKNTGFSFDVGGVYNFKKLTKQPLKLALSVLDISKGIIWNDVKVTKATNVNVTIDKDFFKDSKKLSDKIKPTTSSTRESVTISIPMKFLGSISYDITDNDAFYLTNFTVFNQFRTNNTIALAYTRNLFRDHLNFTVNTSKKTAQPLSFGVGFSAILLGMHIYATTDNLQSFINVSNARLVNINFGINFAFSRYNKKQKKQNEEYPKIKNDEN